MISDEYGRIDIRAGRPCLNWSDREWQCFYYMMKQKILPSHGTIMRGGYERFTVNGSPVRDDLYSGETNYQMYRTYINSVLRTIRSDPHAVDFCYYIYQIADLLQYEPDLRTRLNNTDKYSPHFEVWLE